MDVKPIPTNMTKKEKLIQQLQELIGEVDESMTTKELQKLLSERKALIQSSPRTPLTGEAAEVATKEPAPTKDLSMQEVHARMGKIREKMMSKDPKIAAEGKKDLDELTATIREQTKRAKL